MSSAEKIKKLFAKSKVTVSSKVDDRIVSDALTAFDGAEKTKPVSAGPNIWRLIMKNRITKLATAVAIIIVVFIGVHHFGGQIDGSSVAWGELVKRVEQSHNEYYTELLLAMEAKDLEKVSDRADALSEFWQGINMLAGERLESTEDSLDMLTHESFYGRFQEFEKQIFIVYAEQFIDWMDKIEDEAWIYEIIHVCRQMEEYAEEIRFSGRLPELNFSYAEHCLPGFVTYCQWFEQLPWDNPGQQMTPAILMTGIQRDLEIARREIETLEIRGVIPFIKRCVQQTRKNVLDLDTKTASSRTKKQQDLCKHLIRRIEELCALIIYAEVASQDYLEQIIKENRYDTDAEKFDQVLTEGFSNKGPLADYYIERIDQSLDLCKELSRTVEPAQ